MSEQIPDKVIQITISLSELSIILKCLEEFPFKVVRRPVATLESQIFPHIAEIKKEPDNAGDGSNKEGMG